MTNQGRPISNDHSSADTTIIADVGRKPLAIWSPTVDGELGAMLTENDWAQLRAFVAVYGLFHSVIDDPTPAAAPPNRLRCVTTSGAG